MKSSGDRKGIQAMQSPIHFLLHILVNAPISHGLVQALSAITKLHSSVIFGDPGHSILGIILSSTITWESLRTCIPVKCTKYTHLDIAIMNYALFVVTILTITTRPLGRLGAAVGAAYNGLAAAVGLPAVPAANDPPVAGQPGPAQRRAIGYVLERNHMHNHFHDAPNPLAPIDQDFRAAQNRFQQQLRDANPRAHNANRALDAQGVQAGVEAYRVDAEARRRRIQDLQRQIAELDGRRVALNIPQQAAQAAQPVRPARLANNVVPGAWPGAPGLGNLVANAINPGLGAGVGGGLAFGGPDVNRAVRNREMNAWFEEQLRNVRGQ
jgi:hypothetical protein